MYIYILFYSLAFKLEGEGKLNVDDRTANIDGLVSATLEYRACKHRLSLGHHALNNVRHNYKL